MTIQDLRDKISFPDSQGSIVAWFVIVLSVLITVGATSISRNAILETAESRFLFLTDDIKLSITKRMLGQEAALWGGTGLFNASDQVTRQEWRRYVERLQIETYMPGLQGYGYAEFVKPSERQDHVERVRAEGFPDYDILPEGDRNLLSAIIYLEPFSDRNLRAFGYDMWSEPRRRAAMTRARDTGMAAVSDMVTLVQETDADIQRGFLMYLPVYKKGMKTDTIAERRAAIQGFVYSPFRIKDLMRGILGRGHSEIAFRIYDGSEISEDKLMYDSAEKYTPLTNTVEDEFTASSIVIAGGHRWSLVFRTQPGFISAGELSQPYFIAAGGVIINLLLLLTISSLASQKRRAQALARSMTSELRTAKDIAEHAVETETALREAAQKTNDKLTAANNGLVKFTSIAAHDLRAPLKRIEAFVEILNEDYREAFDEEGQDIMFRINRASTRMRNMLDSLHSYSKLGRSHIGDGDSNLLQVLENARETATGLTADVTYKIDASDDLSIWGDPSLLEHIFLNLISNSVKFRSERPLQIEISAEKSDDGMVSVSVTDNGIGIDPKFAETIFGMFARLHSDEDYEGTGIGLAVCRKIVSDHGGDISLDTDWTDGTRFIVTLRQAALENFSEAA